MKKNEKIDKFEKNRKKKFSKKNLKIFQNHHFLSDFSKLIQYRNAIKNCVKIVNRTKFLFIRFFYFGNFRKKFRKKWHFTVENGQKSKIFKIGLRLCN